MPTFTYSGSTGQINGLVRTFNKPKKKPIRKDELFLK